MNALAVLAVLTTGVTGNSGTFWIEIAPDQPISHVYVDEPLIVELRSSADTEASVSLELQADHLDEPASASLASVTLRANGAYWWAVEDIPTARGRYQVHVCVQSDDAIADLDDVFYRVDRPVAGCAMPVYAYLEGYDRQAPLALKGVSIDSVRIDATNAALVQRIEDVRAMGLRVTVRIDAKGAADVAAEARVLAGAWGEQVARWEVTPGDEPSAVACVARALRQAGARAPLALVTTGPEHLKQCLGRGEGRFVDSLVLEHDAPSPDVLAAVRAAAEQCGYERLTMTVSAAGTQGHLPEQEAGLILPILLHQAARVARTEIPASLVFDGGLAEAYVYLNALAHRLGNAVYIGPSDVVEPVHAPVFRVGATWCIALWVDGEPRDVQVSVGEATDLQLTDMVNNALPTPDREEGRLMLKATASPQFLSGRGGPVLLHAAWNAAREEAAALAGLCTSHLELRTSHLADIAKAIAEADTPKPERPAFLTLLQTLQELERRWHTVEMPRKVAVPALAGLARLVRALCIVEQERQKPFVEPLQGTFARCREYQSLYLTGSAAAPGGRGRGDLLLDEVDRLMAEVKQLKAQGRPIEAAAVAAMAEARARALEHAAKAAPLWEPDRFALQEKKDDEKESRDP